MIQENLASTSWFLPELGLTAGIMLMFLLDLAWKNHPRRVLFLTVGTLLFLGLAGVLLAMQPSAPRGLFNGMIASDPFATFFKWLFLAAAALTVLIAARSTEFGRHQIGVFYPLLLSIVLGMFLMASAVDLLMMYLAVELVSLVSYALAGYRQGDRKAAEAALKYVIYGGVASGIMLFGMSYIYGLTGSTSLLGLGNALDGLAAGATGSSQTALRVALVVAVIFVLCGVGYKIASVPWHMWCPDVYEGAPTPFTAFLSVGPKAAGFALAVRFFWSALAGAPLGHGGAHRGAVRLALARHPRRVGGGDHDAGESHGHRAEQPQTPARVFVDCPRRLRLDGPLCGLGGGRAERDDLPAGLPGDEPGRLPGGHRGGAGHRLGANRRLQGAGSAPPAVRHRLRGLPCFLSPGCRPPRDLPASGTCSWRCCRTTLCPGGGWYAALAVIGALNSAVSLYYYMRVARAMFLEAPVGEVTVRPHLGYQIMLGAFSAALLLFGVWWSPLVDWTQQSLVFLRG